MGKHYKYEFKLKVVQEYLNSSLGYRALAKKYEISTKSLIERWIAQYKEFGPEGLSKRSLLISILILKRLKRIHNMYVFFVILIAIN